jgi:predicted ATP-binding protein involved in virulence
MRISAITLEDFRGIPYLDISFDPHMTIIVGRNGLGKSSILDGLALLLFQLQTSWSRERVKPLFPPGLIKQSDQRIGADDYNIGLKFQMKNLGGSEVPLRLDLRLSEEIRFIRGNESYENLKGFIQNEAAPSESKTLFLYYRQDRGFDDDRALRRISDPATSLFGPLRAISQLESWWDKRDAEEARRVRDTDRNFRDPQLQAVRDLINEIDGYVGLEYSSTGDPEGLYFRKHDGSRVHISSLSTGERSFIILLADLARRLQMSQPEADLDQIPGIILIDEIELNLHPSWQSKIISTLSRVFRACQFIVTTHSPQVISSVESNHVRMLTRNGAEIEVSIPLRTKGQTSNYLLEGVFDAHERYPEIDKLIDAFNTAIDDKDAHKASLLFNKIIVEVEGDPPELLVLRKRLKNLQEKI